MPFTANRQFKKNPRMLAKAKGVHYWTPEGRKIIDGTAGLWCVNAGHGREEIKAAIAEQLEEMDYAPSFQMGHPKAFELAARHAALLPGDLNHAFYCNSGSEAVDSALKIALAYHRARGQGTRTRFVGRERGYHGVGFGGISVGGMVNNRKWFGAMLPGVDHLPHTHLPKNAFSKGQPEHGVELADELERIVGLHDASNIAAVIVEPCAGSTGYLPPPKGYLERLRQICDKHGILLIFDEVITGFGRLGTAFAAEKFGVIPDLMTVAKGITNATVPMGGVFVRKHVFDGLMNGPENAIDLFHGYTYSAHPLACRRGLGGARHLQGRGAVRALGRAVALLGGGRAFAEGPAQRHRHPQSRPRRRHRPRARGRGRHARLQGLHQGLRARPDGAPVGRRHRHVAAAGDREGADRRDHRHHRQDDQGGRLAEPVSAQPRFRLVLGELAAMAHIAIACAVTVHVLL